uniref:Glyco_18 domain-containing protein n=1 Tax=Globodera pallida TaxID=36090 RepID=A0A183C2I3_GLOPA
MNNFLAVLFCAWIHQLAIVSVSSGRVVGYYQGNRAMTSAQAKKLTHLILAFSVPDAQGNLSPLTSVQKQALKTGKSANGALKVLIAIGGGNGLDGADIDWEFPTANDKANYVSFLSELKKALPRGTLLSIASAASAFYLDPGFDLAGIAAAVDFINVMCYDYYGGWSKESTGPNSALYQGGSADPSDSLNTNWTIAYHLTKMRNPGKLNLGVPFYGKYWNNVGAPLKGDGLWRQLGTYGTELAWRDLGTSFDLTKMTYHKTAKTPYIYDASSKKFLTFDNPQSLKDKKTLTRYFGYVLEVIFCDSLLRLYWLKFWINPNRTAKSGLAFVQVCSVKFCLSLPNKTKLDVYSQMRPVPRTKDQYLLLFTKLAGLLPSQELNASSGRIVGYYQGIKKFSCGQKLTHLILAAAFANSDGNLSQMSPILQQAHQTGKAENPHLKMMIAILGYLPSLIQNESRAFFIANIVTFVKNNGLDGVDFPWMYPTANALPSGTLLSIKSAAISNILDPGFDLAGIAAAVDFINVMCYDYYGVWSQSTGPISALYKGGSAEPSDQLNCNWTINYHLSKMHNPEKLNLGMPFYGKFWSNVGAPLNGDGLWRQLGTYGTELAWQNLGKNFNLAQAIYQTTAKTPYIYDALSRIFLTFDNPQSLIEKTSYANLTGLGGIMICKFFIVSVQLVNINVNNVCTVNLRFIGITYKLVCYLKFRLVLPSSAILGNYWNMYPVNGTNNDQQMSVVLAQKVPPFSISRPLSTQIELATRTANSSNYTVEFTNQIYKKICQVKFRIQLPGTATLAKYWNMNSVSGTDNQFTLSDNLNISPGQTFADAGFTVIGDGKPEITILDTKTVLSSKQFVLAQKVPPFSISRPLSTQIELATRTANSSNYTVEFTNQIYKKICQVKFRIQLPGTATLAKYWNMNSVSGTDNQFTLSGNISPGQTFADAGFTVTGEGKPEITILDTKTVLSSKQCADGGGK